MTTLRDAAQQALEALESAIPWIVTDRNTFAQVVRARHFQREDTEIDESILSGYDAVIDDAEKATTALRAALAEQQPLTREEILELAEPFGAFQYGDAQGHKRIDFANAIIAAYERINAYTAPQPRRRLTDEEIIRVAVGTKSAEPGRDGYILPITFARAIEAAVWGEKT